MSNLMFFFIFSKLSNGFEQQLECSGCTVHHKCLLNLNTSLRHSSAKVQYPPLSVLLFCSCHEVFHNQEVCIAYLVGQIVT